MKRMIASALAVALVTVGAPALAHEAAYPGECDDRDRNWHCEHSDEVAPAHKKCDGTRNHMWTDENFVKESLTFPLSDEAGIGAYVHSADQSVEGETGPAGLMPGLVWLESNGFSGLQRTDYECTSDAHDEPGTPKDHSDKVLI